MMYRIIENLEIEERVINENGSVTKNYYAIDSEVGKQLIKDNNLEIDAEMQEV